MPTAIVIGGGLAGLSTAAALGSAGFRVDVYESRPYLGGRATSYPLNAAADAETIDNCQHILLRCCVNLLDFYKRLNVADRIQFHRSFYFIEPGGRTSTLAAGRLPKPFHFTGSFLHLSFLSLAEKLAVGRGLLAIQRERSSRQDLDRITMLNWLREKRQPQRAIDRFWNQVLVSAINEEVGRMAALHAFQVFWLGFLASAQSYQMGIPAVPLAQLYGSDAWRRIGNVQFHVRSPVEQLVVEDGAVRGVQLPDGVRIADYYVSALPFERLPSVAPNLGVDVEPFSHSPITGIHLWFDRSITQLPHATLLDRTVQWMYNKDRGRYLMLVVSASRSLTDMPRNEVIALAIRELGEFFPAARDAKLEKAHVVKEIRATFSARPGLEEHRPPSRTRFPNLFLAGDWTRSGWPATMEGAVRSGYLAAEAITSAVGEPRKFLLPDIG
jgi:zeta-carotene desaturase